jgi:hypothetical protein
MPVFIGRIWRDLQHGGRMLAKNPGLTVVAVLSLANGLDASVAMFCWADALSLRPLPAARPGEVVSRRM